MRYKATSCLYIVFGILVALTTQPVKVLAQATCPTITTTQTAEVLGTNASPDMFLWNNNANEGFSYGNANASPSLQFSVQPAAGSGTSPTVPGNMQLNTSGPLGDVTAATYDGTTFFVYLPNGSTTYDLIASDDGGNPSSFGSPYQLAISGFPVGAEVNNDYTPALIAYNGMLFIAYEIGNYVYLGYSSDGSLFYQLGEVSATTTATRPALAVYGNDLVMAYITGTTSSTRFLVTGPVEVDGTFSPNLVTQGSAGNWSQSNHSMVYSGVALVTYNGSLYVFGQDTDANQYMQSTNSTSETSFGAPGYCYSPSGEIQERFTPSAVQLSNGGLGIAYQSDDNTDVTYGTVAPPA